MSLNFNQFASEANTFMKMYAKELKMEGDTEAAGRILSSILHGIREIISAEESLQLMAQLPMFLKAVYVNGWSSHKKEKVKNKTDLFCLIREFDGVTAWHDFESDAITETYIKTTFIVLRKYISFGELEDIRTELPKDLKSLIYEQILI